MPGKIHQPAITAERIEELMRWSPRRYRLTDWKALNPPRTSGGDYMLGFPFRETFGNVFEATCPVGSIGLRESSSGRPFTFLKCPESDIDKVRTWLATFERHVAIRDLLALSFALDYDREGGDPGQPQTVVGQLRKRAKPYDQTPTQDNYAAANHLAGLFVDFLERVAAYSAAEVVVAMPPSSPGKGYVLPRLIAQQIATRWRRIDGSNALRATRARPQLKNVAAKDKLAALEGTFELDPTLLRGRVILLVDDLYQSGVSMNGVAMKILEAGATAVFGVAAEKTCRNDDNVRRSEP